ncbi:hypothetical protein CCR75_007783 [Bremia lactucae]|uniref:C2H2-type domain-containing protein n=1 Tax=Bremia lactucae TaxID=4779 RepID=A0A976IIT6_BRELC|nr:hypothetical protein CCR75_007783 [Bremia lactucae]
MQHERLRAKREILVLVERLNDCVSASARRMYTQHVLASALLQRPQSEIRRQLPELCTFIDSLTFKATTMPAPSLVRSAFRHPGSQWLNRSARESGVSALLCQQLVRLARQDTCSGNKDDSTENWTAAELTTYVLLDALLVPCKHRFGKASDACVWRPTQSKPRFHAMTCFPVWSTILPFAALMGLRFTNLFLLVLVKYRQMELLSLRVNCTFAQITGIWRLMEELDRGDVKKDIAVTDVMIELLRLSCDIVLDNSMAKKDRTRSMTMHLDDQILEKFFMGLQDFAFKSWRSNLVLKPALLDSFQSSRTALGDRTKAFDVPQRAIVFSTVGCLFVQGLAEDIVSMLLDQIFDNASISKEANDLLLSFLVGLCAHVDLVSLTSVLKLLTYIVATYKSIEEKNGNSVVQRQKRLDLIFYLVYVASHRSQSIETLRHDGSSQAAMVKDELSRFQVQLCSDIAFEEFYIAAPVHWTIQLWKHWVHLSDEDVETFLNEAEEYDTDSKKEFEARFAAWHALVARISLKPATFWSYTRMKALLNPHIISTLPLTNDCAHVQPRKRRRTGTATAQGVCPRQLECSLDVLLLPDVMERVCSYLSAKRLIRIALVCRPLAEISRLPSLWRPLYIHFGLQTRKKATKKPLTNVMCLHGESYEHDWCQLYKERWKGVRRLRRLQHQIIKKQTFQTQNLDHDSDLYQTSRAMPVFMPQICSICSCNQVLKSADDLKLHQEQHKLLTCTEVSCRASFTNLQKFKAHIRMHEAKSLKRLECGFKNCGKIYTTSKRLATHRQKEGH